MQPPIFYASEPSILNDGLTLPKAEAHHAAKVLRLKKGALVIVVDGLGNAYRAAIDRVTRTGIVEVRIHSKARNFGEPNVVMTLASGLSAGHKFDSLIEKGTEIGVKRFVPLLTEKSKVRIEDPKRVRTKLNRYEKVAVAAMKQCRRSYRPEITSPVRFGDYLNELDESSLSLIFHPSSKGGRLEDVPLDSGQKRVNIIVGPESGFSEDEVDLALAKGARIVSLGSRILRTETAGPVVCALVMNWLGELR